MRHNFNFQIQINQRYKIKTQVKYLFTLVVYTLKCSLYKDTKYLEKCREMNQLIIFTTIVSALNLTNFEKTDGTIEEAVKHRSAKIFENDGLGEEDQFIADCQEFAQVQERQNAQQMYKDYVQQILSQQLR